MRKRDIQRGVLTELQRSPYRSNVRRIALFGSQLHGGKNAKSDIDLLIEFHHPMSMLKLVRLERDLSQTLGKNVDLRTPASISRYFRDDVLREAETLYATAP